MVVRSDSRNALVFLLSLWSLASQAQGVKLDSSKLVVPKAATVPVPSLAAQMASGGPAAILGSAQYLTLRPGIARLLGVPESSLAYQILPSLNLAIPGATVGVTLGLKPPTGFLWSSMNAISSPGSGGVPLQGGGTAIYANFTFTAKTAPPGVYLMTVYVKSQASVNCLVYEGAVNGPFSIAGAIGTTPVPVQNGMLIVPFVKKVASDLTITLAIPHLPMGAAAVTVYSCDFMRLK